MWDCCTGVWLSAAVLFFCKTSIIDVNANVHEKSAVRLHLISAGVAAIELFLINVYFGLMFGFVELTW